MSSEAISAYAGRPDPNIQQRRASQPDSIVWVSASAGSGKTKVLTDRVLRLLLPDPEGRWFGTLPHKLLCITYTKAGAAEMAIRVNDRLGKWAVMPEPDLANDIGKLTGVAATQTMIGAARKLFAAVLDCPGGLKIMTIHGFCQSVLARFPLEARVSPDFSVLDEQMAEELLSRALDHVLKDAQSGKQADLATAFRRLAVSLQLDDLAKNIRFVLQKPGLLEEFFHKTRTLEDIEGDMKESFGLKRGSDAESLRNEFITATPERDIRAVITAFSGGGVKLQAYGADLQTWLDLAPADRARSMAIYGQGLLTNEGNIRKLTDKFRSNEPDLAMFYEAEARRFLEYQDQQCLLQQCSVTAALLLLSQATWASYEKEKHELDGLDYNDLIRKTERLLKSTSGDWVHFKLDGGIDHILMDEAQDTNPHQWNILEQLSREIFAGIGRDTQSPRSLFVVGDKKQSIFSFQGADPAAFDRMNAFFAEKSAAAERSFEKVPLDVSFRSSSPVLKLTDTVFDDPDLRRQIGIDPATPLIHYPWRAKDSGLVELWPVIPRPVKSKSDTWELPFANLDDKAAGESLATQIAAQISFWLQGGERLESEGRAITPGDILILVRTRTPFVHELVRQLKRRDIAVSGIDRLALGDQIAVQDLLALSRFARLPDDDFSLACVLKSPLIGWNDDQLMQAAMDRSGTLWDALKSRETYREIVVWLQRLITLASEAPPFEFLETILNAGCPADPSGTGWRAITGRLGHDVIDPLEELMSLALKLEGQGVRTLEDLLLWQQKTDIQIKREMEEAGGQVRIMTVHAAKGLEAPIVILPDTTSVPTMANVDKFIWPEKSGLPVPLWTPRGADSCRIFEAARTALLAEQRAEHARLLYVALTRARDRLYIMGMEPRTQATTWYSLISDAFTKLPNVEGLENGRLRFSVEQAETATPVTILNEGVRVPSKAPSWLSRPPQAEPDRPRPITPSHMDDLATGHHSPYDAAQPYRRLRGIITHKLFELLPDLPPARHKDAAEHFVSRGGRDLPEHIRLSIIDETLRILRDPVFAPVFAPGSLAEVPVTGTLPDGRLVSAQIDRLVIRQNEILIVDFKTNRPSPIAEADIPEIYRSQLRAYRDVLAQIYPNLLIKCAILWTDQPLLMPVSI